MFVGVFSSLEYRNHIFVLVRALLIHFLEMIYQAVECIIAYIIDMTVHILFYFTFHIFKNFFWLDRKIFYRFGGFYYYKALFFQRFQNIIASASWNVCYIRKLAGSRNTPRKQGGPYFSFISV